MQSTEPPAPTHVPANGPPSVWLASPPGIPHALLWTACCAVYLATVRGFIPPGFESSWLLHLALWTAPTGAAWMGMVLVIAAKLGWLRGQVAWGAWLLFSLGVGSALGLAAAMLPYNAVVQRESLGPIIALAGWILPLLSRRLTPRVKTLFLALGATFLFRSHGRVAIAWAFHLLQPADHSFLAQLLRWPWFNHLPVALMAIVVASLLARPAARQQGWLHALGLLCVLAYLTSSLLQMAVYLYLP